MRILQHELFLNCDLQERIFNHVTANQLVERTNTGGQPLAVWPAVCAPAFAAHLQR